MAINTQLLHAAAELAERAEQHALASQRELAEIEARKVQLQAEYEIARRAAQRLATFEAKIGLNFQCPYCWIENERRSALSPSGGEIGGEESLRCGACGSEFKVRS
jgi:hypothetical protein